MYLNVISQYMLTENRREYLKTRPTEEDKGKIAEYDYRLLKWLQAMLDGGEKGGIGDMNRVMDTLDRASVRKYLKDENVYSLLKLVFRLMDMLDFVPVVFTTKDVEYDGKKIPTTSAHIEKSIMVAPPSDGELSVFTTYRKANDTDLERYHMVKNHIEQLKLFIEPGAHTPDPRSADYFKDQIENARAQGLRVLAYDDAFWQGPKLDFSGQFHRKD
jgi:hypothetical protein